MSNVIIPIVAIAVSAGVGIAGGALLPQFWGTNSGVNESVAVNGSGSDGSGSDGSGYPVTYVGNNPELAGEYTLDGTALFDSNGQRVATVINMYDGNELYDSNVYMGGSFVGKLQGGEWTD